MNLANLLRGIVAYILRREVTRFVFRRKGL